MMSGRVLEGRFAGRTLRDLSLQNLLDLWRECQSDAQSLAVLEAYLDRHVEAGWREQVCDTGPTADSNRNSGVMDRAEAYQILGLQPGASREDIQAAYRRLIQRVHPDHGGSSYLAARLNQARDVLLGVN
jgi:DnaJ-domain-containing protein 1